MITQRVAKAVFKGVAVFALLGLVLVSLPKAAWSEDLVSSAGDSTPSGWAIHKIPRLTGPRMEPNEGGFLLGPLRLHGGISLIESYSDNIYQESTNPTSGWYTNYSPFFLATLGQGRHDLEFEYKGDFLRNDGDHSNANYDHTYLAGRFKLDFPGGLLLTGGDEFIMSSNAPTSNTDTLKKYQENVPSLNAVYTFADRYSIGATYQRAERRFDESINNIDDRDKDDVAVDLYYRIMPKTRAFLEFGWDKINYPNRIDAYNSKGYRVFLGLRSEPTAKLAGLIKGGFTSKKYGDNTVADNRDDWGLEGSVEYKLTTRIILGLDLFRMNQDTEFTTIHNPTYGASYDRTGAVLRARYNMTERFTLRGQTGYEKDDYYKPNSATGESRNDDIYFAGLGAEYQIWKAIFLSLDYRYADDTSNIDGQGYRENRIVANITIGY